MPQDFKPDKTRAVNDSKNIPQKALEQLRFCAKRKLAVKKNKENDKDITILPHVSTGFDDVTVSC